MTRQVKTEVDRDGRHLSRETQEALRIRAVLRVRKDGESPEVVIASLGLHRATIYRWLKRYDEGGLEALRRRKAPGAPGMLQTWQLDWLAETIEQDTPLRFGFEVALWTGPIIREVLGEQFDVWPSEVTIRGWLRRWGLSPQKPTRRAYEQDPKAVKRWLKHTFPAIRREAKAAGAALYFGDEASVRSDHHSGTTWAAVGQTPVVPTSGKRFGVNALSAISPRGQLRFMLTDKRVTSRTFCQFLERLMRGAERPIVLIVDNSPIHHAKRVKQFVAKTEGRLTLHHLPPYAPEYNPDEWIWGQVKHHRLGKEVIEDRTSLKRQLLGHLRSLQKMPALIRQFFKAPSLQYISAE